MVLEIGDTELHGNVVEISGRTEPGAALIINGESVADIHPDGTFKYFTQSLGARQPYDCGDRTKSPGRHSHQALGNSSSVARPPARYTCRSQPGALQYAASANRASRPELRGS